MTAAGAKAILYDTLDPDLFWHLRVADQLDHQSFPGPIVDHLSFASDKSPWTPYSWLADLAIKRLWTWGGYRAVIATEALLTAALVLFIGLSALEITRAQSARPRYLSAALAAFVAEFLSLPYLSFRPVTFALVLLALIALLLQRDRRMNGRSRAVWCIIPLTALLANVHLYVIFAPLAVATALLAAAWETRLLLSYPLPIYSGGGSGWGLSTKQRSSAICLRPSHKPQTHLALYRHSLLLLATALAALATPMLPGALRTAWHYQFNDLMVRGNTIAEMQPFYRGQLGSISAALVAIVIAAALLNHRRLTPQNWLLLIIGLIAIFRLGRFAPIFAIFAAPTLAATLPNFSDAVLGRRPVRVALAALLAVMALRVGWAFPDSSVPLSAWLNRLGPENPGYPTQAADFVQATLTPRTGRLINEFTWGGFLEWRLGDQYQVLMDGRTQVFPADYWKAAYLGTHQQRRDFLAQQHADAAIVPVKGSAFQQDLLELGWKIVWRDARAEVLTPPTAALPDNETPATAATSKPHSSQYIAARDNAS
jgi:hypothetical protein